MDKILRSAAEAVLGPDRVCDVAHHIESSDAGDRVLWVDVIYAGSGALNAGEMQAVIDRIWAGVGVDGLVPVVSFLSSKDPRLEAAE